MIGAFALIIGSMKSGTTSLFRYLAEHPELAASRLKEPNFFSRDNTWSKGIRWYQDLFPWEEGVHKRALEASTGYTRMPFLPDPTERMAATGWDFRFIYVMRDPIGRIESHLRHGRSRGWDYTTGTLSTGVHDKLIAITRYATQLDPYVARFGRDSVLLLLHEDLREQPQVVVRRTCEFLEIDPEYSFQGLGKSHGTGDRTVLPSWYTRIRSWPAVKRLSGLIPRKRWIARQVMRANVAQPLRLSEEVRSSIAEQLRDDVRRLRDDYGVDVSGWSIEV